MRDDSEDGLEPVAWPMDCPANQKARRRRVWCAIRRTVGAALWGAVKKAVGLAWMAAKVWVAFWVARLAVPEFFYPSKKTIEVGVDAAVMMVGVLLAVCFLTRDN